MFPISHLRLSAQQVENPRARTPQELVAHMGALQAQDFAMSKWAIGCRIPDSTEADVEAALNKGEILRARVAAHLAPGGGRRHPLDVGTDGPAHQGIDEVPQQRVGA